MRHFVINGRADGAIAYTAFSTLGAEDIQANWPVPDGCEITWMEAPLSAPADHYRVADGAVTERAEMAPAISKIAIAADGLDEAVISGLPSPCIVEVRGAVMAGPLDVTGGALAITSTAPGEIRISVRADPVYKPWGTTIHAA